ncbi:MAG: hypothetical protein FJY65_06790 [Calditrichaeota bacterium]|nr:hypothetical protein [Calditrichota bacterium]
MKPETLLDELEAVAARIFSEIRRDEGFFQTAVCRIRAKNVLIINTRQPMVERIAALAREIARHHSERIYLKPAVRAEIDNYKV